MNLGKHQKAVVALIIANFIWGAASPIFKWSLGNIEPFTLAFLRFSLAALLILPFVFKNLHLEKEDWPKLIILTFFGITANISFFFLGLKLAPSINAPIIGAGGPVILILASLFFLKEKFRLKVAAGTALGLLGVLTIIFLPVFDGGFEPTLLGNLFFVIATLGAVGQTVMTKQIIGRYPIMTITFWNFLIGALTFIPFMAYEIGQKGFLTNLAWPGLIGILFGAVFASTFAYSLYNWSVKCLAAQEVGVFVYLDPIVAVLIAMPLLGERPSPVYLLGSCLVFLGIIIAEGNLPYTLHRTLKAGQKELQEAFN